MKQRALKLGQQYIIAYSFIATSVVLLLLSGNIWHSGSPVLAFYHLERFFWVLFVPAILVNDSIQLWRDKSNYKRNGYRVDVVTMGLTFRYLHIYIAFYFVLSTSLLLWRDAPLFLLVYLLLGGLLVKFNNYMVEKEQDFNRPDTLSDHGIFSICLCKRKVAGKVVLGVSAWFSSAFLVMCLAEIIFVENIWWGLFSWVAVGYFSSSYLFFLLRRLYWRHSLWCSLRTAYFEAF